MPGTGENIKKIYDETASVIASLSFRKKISDEEMYFLLNLLDYIVVKKGNREFLSALGEWVDNQGDSETDSIIKATLMAVDFNDKDSVNTAICTIEELIRPDNH